MPVFNLIEYCNNYSEISGILWQYYGDKRSIYNVGTTADFLDNKWCFV